MKPRKEKPVRSFLVARAALALVLLSSLFLAKPTEAAFPGDNGRIAFTSDRDGNAGIYARAQRGLVLVTDLAVPLYTSERREVLLRITTMVRHMVEHTNR